MKRGTPLGLKVSEGGKDLTHVISYLAPSARGLNDRRKARVEGDT